MARRKTRRTEEQRRREEEARRVALEARASAAPPVPEPQPRRIPGPRQLPVPEPTPPPVPVVNRFPQPIQPAQSPVPADRFAELFRGGGQFERQRLPVLPGAEFVARNIVRPVEELFRGIAGGVTPTPQTSLLEDPQFTTGEPHPGQFDYYLPSAAYDPLNTIEAAAGHFYTSLQFGTRPPFVLFGVQARLGYTDADMDELGYIRTLAGWVRLPREKRVATAAGTPRASGSTRTVYVGGGGGGSRYRATPGSSLVNWRI